MSGRSSVYIGRSKKLGSDVTVGSSDRVDALTCKGQQAGTTHQVFPQAALYLGCHQLCHLLWGRVLPPQSIIPNTISTDLLSDIYLSCLDPIKLAIILVSLL